MSLINLRYKFKFLFLIIGLFFFLDEFFLKKYSIKASTIKSEYKIKKKINNNFFLKDFSISKENKQFGFYLYNAIKSSKNNYYKLFASSLNKENPTTSVDIEADIQYKSNNIFYAEGNVIIYLFNGILTGDKASFNSETKEFLIEGNVTFTIGSQYFEALKISHNFRDNEGFVDDVYGVLDLNSFDKDLNLKNSENIKDFFVKANNVSDPSYINTSTIGLVNEFEEDKRFNITEVKFDIPQVERWRFKSKKLVIKSNKIYSKDVFFTNDLYNKPQFFLRTKKFSGELVNDKLKIISRRTSLIFDNKVTVPIGRRSVFDSDPLTKWGIGADFAEKDGYFLFRGTEPKKIFGDNFSLKLQPYFLLQRAIKDNTNSFTEENSSIFSEKVKTNAEFMDNFALDIDLSGKVKSWNLDSSVSLNTLNLKRLDQAVRSKITLSKRIDLNEKKDLEGNYDLNEKEKLESNLDLNNLEFLDDTKSSFGDNLLGDFDAVKINLRDQENEKKFDNFLDIKFYNLFREKVTKDFATEDIYFASGVSVANKKSWSENRKNSQLSFINDFGHFKSKSRTYNGFENLFRNVLYAEYNYNYSIWENNSIDETINQSYKFSPKVINQSIQWATSFQQGFFLYSDGSSQNVSKFKSGPVFTLGSLKNKFLDYTLIDINYNYTLKGSESPFSFDNINPDPKIVFNFKQQLYGPIMFSYETTYNLESNEYSDPNYGVDIKRRAYSVGAFYNSAQKSLGIKFNIFNFDYKGISSSF